MAEGLIVDLKEFAELVGVTAETMRVHLGELGKDGATLPAWLVERGDRGRAYKIEAEGALAWWQAKRDSDDLADQERKGQLQQMRLRLVGDTAEGEQQLTLSGKARREEYLAAQEAIKYRRGLGQLVEKVKVESVISSAAVELRRKLQQVAPEFGIAAGLPPAQIKDLDRRIGRAVDAFVTAISAPGALAD